MLRRRNRADRFRWSAVHLRGLVEGDRKIAKAAQPPPWNLLQTTAQQRAHFLRSLFGKEGPIPFVPQHCGQEIGHRVPTERLGPGQAFIQTAPECPHVPSPVHRLPTRLFRAQIGRCAHHSAGIVVSAMSVAASGSMHPESAPAVLASPKSRTFALPPAVSFTLEAGESVAIPGKALRKHLDGDFPVQLGVGGVTHRTHPALAEFRGDSVMSDGLAGHHAGEGQILPLGRNIIQSFILRRPTGTSRCGDRSCCPPPPAWQSWVRPDRCDAQSAVCRRS